MRHVPYAMCHVPENTSMINLKSHDTHSISSSDVQEYIPEEGSAPSEGKPTVAVVSIILEIQGDETK